MASLPRHIRAVLANPNYLDMDMCRAFPTILHGELNKYNITNPFLNRYISCTKDDYNTIANDMNLSPQKLKNEMYRVIMSKNYNSYGNYPELDKLNKEIYTKLFPLWIFDSNYSQLWKDIEKSRNKGYMPWTEEEIAQNEKDNKEGTFVAYYLQDNERKIMENMIEFLQGKGYNIDTYIHDGFLIRNDNLPSPEIMKTACDTLLEEFGVTVKFVYKPFDMSFDFVGGDLPISTNLLNKELFNDILRLFPDKVPDELCELLYNMTINIVNEPPIIQLLKL